MKKIMVISLFIITMFFPLSGRAQTPVGEKVGVLITGWGMPSGYNFNYSWYSSDYARCGDLTEFEGQPCKIGHVGGYLNSVLYMAHMNLIPWGICFETPGVEFLYDSIGVYILKNGRYVSPNPAIPSLLPSDIPSGVPIIPLVDYYSTQSKKYPYAADPRTGEDYVEGWYRIGGYGAGERFANGFSDLDEEGPSYYMRYYGHLTSPEDPAEWTLPPSFVQTQEAYTRQMLEDSFGDRIDIREGFYGNTEATQLEWDVAEDFVNEGFTKLLLARETTDHNRYANEFFTGNYVKERLCELEVLDDIAIYQTRQVGRTPEFHSMNVENLKPYIESYPLGSTIAMVYATRGLPWGGKEPIGKAGQAHPWSKEVYFENAYLNYLAWKAAVKKAYGDRYNLVFTKGGIDSDLLADNFFTFGLSEEVDLLGYGGEQYFYGPRDALAFAVADGIDKVIIAPCHWNYDNLDTILRMKEINKFPLTPKTLLKNEKFAWTHYEDALGNAVSWDSPDAAVGITIAPSYSHLPRDFATAYYVVLRGTLERFGLFPDKPGDLEEPTIHVTQNITKLNGGTIEVTTPTSPINIQGAKIVIPPDPYPTRPDDFTPATAIPVNDPADTYDCLWEDTTINIGLQLTTPSSDIVQFVGPAVYMGPYRTFFNRDVTITIPYDSSQAGSQTVRAYIYNHLKDDWDSITPDTVNAIDNLVTFRTKVLGLFRAGVGDEDDDGVADLQDNCPSVVNPGQEDADGDGQGNACDTDDDNDTVPDGADNCPQDANLDQADTDSDGIGNACDNCPATSNPDQGDADRDTIGNVCDICPHDEDNDIDGDTVCGVSAMNAAADNCPAIANQEQANSDSDWLGDSCDNCPTVNNPHQEDTYPPGGNGMGNACECEGNFDADGDCDGTDAAKFKLDFGRNQFNRPCISGNHCNGDFICDGDVDGTDAALFKADFGRNSFNQPCIAATTNPWCAYP